MQGARFDEADTITSPDTDNVAMGIEDGQIVFEADNFGGERFAVEAVDFGDASDRTGKIRRRNGQTVGLYDRPDDVGWHDRLDVFLQFEHRGGWYKIFSDAGRADLLEVLRQHGLDYLFQVKDKKTRAWYPEQI